jgi:nucleoside-diphosphate-sugar epimerase
MSEKIVVCGAAGFVGRWLIKELLRKGYDNIRAISYRSVEQWPMTFPGVECVSDDLRDLQACKRAVAGAERVYNFCGNVGGIGHVVAHDAECMLSAKINMNLVEASCDAGISGYFFASSSCVYPDLDCALKETDAYPANPMGGYGWEKIFSERLCLAAQERYGLPVRIARYHGIYGPGDFRGEGRDHVIAAMCQKFVEAKLSGRREINIWGNGEQRRCFLWIGDCAEGTNLLMNSAVNFPVNMASRESYSVNEIVTLLEEISAVKVVRFYSADAVQGRKVKTSDNTLLRSSLQWEPMTSLKIGLDAAYRAAYDRAVIK